MKIEESTFVWKANADESIPCHKMHIKCDNGTLELRSFFPKNHAKKLVERA